MHALAGMMVTFFSRPLAAASNEFFPLMTSAIGIVPYTRREIAEALLSCAGDLLSRDNRDRSAELCTPSNIACTRQRWRILKRRW